jgi:hypothetical protein
LICCVGTFYNRSTNNPPPTTNRHQNTHTQAHFDRAQQLAPAAAFVYLWRCQLWMCGKLTEESLKKAEAELNK